MRGKDRQAVGLIAGYRSALMSVVLRRPIAVDWLHVVFRTRPARSGTAFRRRGIHSPGSIRRGRYDSSARLTWHVSLSFGSRDHRDKSRSARPARPHWEYTYTAAAAAVFWMRHDWTRRDYSHLGRHRLSGTSSGSAWDTVTQPPRPADHSRIRNFLPDV